MTFHMGGCTHRRMTTTLAVVVLVAAVGTTIISTTTVTAFSPIVLTPMDHHAPSTTVNHNRQYHKYPIQQHQHQQYVSSGHFSPLSRFPKLGMANYMNYNNDYNSYNNNGYNNDYRYNANNNNLYYGTGSYNQRVNDGYSGGVNLSSNGRSQQENLRRRSFNYGDRNDDYMYDDYYRNRYTGYGGVYGGGDYFYRTDRPTSYGSMQSDRNRSDRYRMNRADNYHYDDISTVASGRRGDYGPYGRQYYNTNSYYGDRGGNTNTIGGGGLMRYRPNDYYDSSSSFYNLEGKRVRRFDPYYDQANRFYDQGALYDRERAMAEGRRGREYTNLRRYDPYYDGPNGLYDEAALYEGKAAGLRRYSLDPYYDEDRMFMGGDGVRRRPMSSTTMYNTPYGSGGTSLEFTGGRRRLGRSGDDPNVIGSDMYNRRPMNQKYYPPTESEERNRNRPGAMQSRRRSYDDDGKRTYGPSSSSYYDYGDSMYYDNDYYRSSSYAPFIRNMEDDSMESFREGRGVRKSTFYNDNDYFYGSNGNGYVSGPGMGGSSGKPIMSNDDRYNYVSRGRSYINGGNYGGRRHAASVSTSSPVREYAYSGGGGSSRGGTINGSYYPPPTNPRGPANGGMSIDDLKEML